jgi:hypothetical protein
MVKSKGCRQMIKTIIQILFIVAVIDPLQATAYIPEDEYLSMVNHLLDGWSVKEDKLANDLKVQLAAMKSDEVCDVMAKTCALTNHKETALEKSSTAIALAKRNPNDRDELYQLTGMLKKVYSLSSSQILDAFTEVPAPQRSAVYKAFLMEKNKPNDANLKDYVSTVLLNLNLFQKLGMYIQYKFSNQSSSKTETTYMPIVDHLMGSWKPGRSVIGIDLVLQLGPKTPEDIYDLMAKTCDICAPQEDSHRKTSVAYILSGQKPTDRQQVSRMAIKLREFYKSKNQERSMIDILWALFEVPSFQRKTIYHLLKEASIAKDATLFSYVSDVTQTFNDIEVASMYAQNAFFSSYPRDIVEARLG